MTGMARLDLWWRCKGLAALGIAAGSALAHRTVFEAHRAGPPSAWEAVFGLLAFAAASVGVLLLVHGRRLFGNRAVGTVASEIQPGMIDDRHACAAALAARAIERARRRGRNVTARVDERAA